MALKTLKMEPLKKHIGYNLYSGFVRNKPRDISTLIIAYPERAKSTEVQKFRAVGATEVQDLSSYGILKYLKRLSEKERAALHHILVPDLEKVASRSKRLKEELLSTIRILTEEGFKRSEVRGQRFNFKKRVQVGFILCTTPDDIGDRRSAFRSYSFLSRFIPFTYDFSEGLKVDILKFVQDAENMVIEKYWIKREEKVDVEFPKPLMAKLDPQVSAIASSIDRFSRKTSIPALNGRVRSFGVRMKQNLITYVKAIALYDGYEIVRKSHIKEYQSLFPFMNYSFNDIDTSYIPIYNKTPVSLAFVRNKGVVHKPRRRLPKHRRKPMIV